MTSVSECAVDVSGLSGSSVLLLRPCGSLWRSRLRFRWNDGIGEPVGQIGELVAARCQGEQWQGGDG